MTTEQSDDEKAAEEFRNNYRPYLRKAELAGEWCAQSTITHRECFLAGAKWARENPEWVRCADRLPEFGQWCLVFQRFENGDTQFEVDHYLNDELADDHFEKWAYAENKTITHWMPLPNPPQELEEKGGF